MRLWRMRDAIKASGQQQLYTRVLLGYSLVILLTCLLAGVLVGIHVYQPMYQECVRDATLDQNETMRVWSDEHAKMNASCRNSMIHDSSIVCASKDHDDAVRVSKRLQRLVELRPGTLANLPLSSLTMAYLVELVPDVVPESTCRIEYQKHDACLFQPRPTMQDVQAIQRLAIELTWSLIARDADSLAGWIVARMRPHRETIHAATLVAVNVWNYVESWYQIVFIVYACWFTMMLAYELVVAEAHARLDKKLEFYQQDQTRKALSDSYTQLNEGLHQLPMSPFEPNQMFANMQSDSIGDGDDGSSEQYSRARRRHT